MSSNSKAGEPIPAPKKMLEEGNNRCKQKNLSLWNFTRFYKKGSSAIISTFIHILTHWVSAAYCLPILNRQIIV